MLLALSCCGPSDDDRILAALHAKLPNGIRRCAMLDQDSTGIHVQQKSNQDIFYPATGPTSPLRHPFIFYVGPESGSPPELVSLLIRQGLLHRKLVVVQQLTVTGGSMPQEVSAKGIYWHPGWIKNQVVSEQVAIYETIPYDTHFDYAVITGNSSFPGVERSVFPSRVYDAPITEAIRYVMPVTHPYAASMVTSVCSTEPPVAVRSVQHAVNWTGVPYVQADVRFDTNADAWMKPPAFRRSISTVSPTDIETPEWRMVRLEIENGSLVAPEFMP